MLNNRRGLNGSLHLPTRNMRTIKYIVIHCSAGYGNLEAVLRFWRTQLGWKSPGYHFFIELDGTVHILAPLSAIVNGVKGYNSNSVHICYQGGVLRDNYNKAADTRTPEQKWAIEQTIRKILAELRKTQSVEKIIIQGHRDFSPDKNGNGVIEPWERIKECPSFDAIPEYKHLKFAA